MERRWGSTLEHIIQIIILTNNRLAEVCRDVLGLPRGQLVNYEMLLTVNVIAAQRVHMK